MSREIIRKNKELTLAVNNYFLNLNEHSIGLFLATIGWIGIPNEYKFIKLLALIGIALFFFYYISRSKAWMLSKGESFKQLILMYKKDVKESTMTEYRKNRELIKLEEIENKYFNFRKYGLKIVSQNYYFFFTAFFLGVAVINQYSGIKFC